MAERSHDVQETCANYAPPTYPSLPALPKNTDSPSIQTSTTSTCEPDHDVDGPSDPGDLSVPAPQPNPSDELDLDEIEARAREALQAVRALHCECTTGNCACGGGPGWCHGCDEGWPCSTVRALDAALDGSE